MESKEIRYIFVNCVEWPDNIFIFRGKHYHINGMIAWKLKQDYPKAKIHINERKGW